MKQSRIDRRVRSAVQAIEMLEARCLLSATVVAQVPTQSISTSAAPAPVVLSNYFDNPGLTGTVVRMTTNFGNIDIETLDAQKPISVSNFLSYVTSGAYTDTIIHRSAALVQNASNSSEPVQIIQGGAFSAPSLQPITTQAPITNEYDTNGIVDNTAGTISYARTSDVHSATSQFFFNVTDNSVPLGDTPQTAGYQGYVVFGNVIDGTMSTVNTIAALPRYDVSGVSGVPSSSAGALTQLPLQNYTTPTVPTDSNLVIIQSAAVIPPLTYSVTSSNASVVTGSVANGDLQLTPGATGGTATVTATATDPSGGTATSTFAVDVASSSPNVLIGSGGAKTVTYVDPNGTTGVVTLKGAGSATVSFAGTSISQTTAKNAVTVTGTGLGISSIVTTGTSATSTLTITTKGGTKAIDVAGITTDALRSITGKGVTLTGNLTSSASIGTVSLAAATGGAVSAVSIGTWSTPGDFSDNLTLSGAALNKFSADAITGTWFINGSANSITVGSAPNWNADFVQSVKTITIKRNLAGAITATSIGSLKVAGNITADTITLSAAGADLGKLSVGGSISGSLISTLGNIGAVTAASLANSEIYAGVSSLSGENLPTLPSQIGSASITSVKLKGSSAGNAFSDSDIAASSLGTISVGTITTFNNGLPNGVAAATIKSLSGTANKKFTLKKLSTATDLATLLSADGVTLGDFTINLL